MWIAVFKTGRHTDSKGNEKTWTEGDLDRIAASYDARTHEAPVVIGHPRDNAPAYGWVEGLKRTGDTLWAKVKPTAAEFADWLKAGLFKKRSISLYPDMTLRHVGFLGAMPPAVKGLPDFAFGGGEAAEMEFEEFVSEGPELNRKGFEHAMELVRQGKISMAPDWSISPDEENEMLGKEKDWNAYAMMHLATDPGENGETKAHFKYPFGKGGMVYCAALKAIRRRTGQQTGSMEGGSLSGAGLAAREVFDAAGKLLDAVDKKKGGRMNFWEELKGFLKGKGIEVDGADQSGKAWPGSFSEAEVKAAVEKAKTQMQAEFSEKENALKEKEAEIARRYDEMKNRADEARKKEVAEFCEALKKQGRLVPAMEKLGMGITAFMQALAGIETVYEFAEAGEDGKKATERPLEFMQAFLARLPRAIEFKEVARDEEDPGGGDENEKRERAIRAHMKEHKMGYKEAMLAVSKKHPEMFGREVKK